MNDDKNPSWKLLVICLLLNTTLNTVVSRYMAGNMWKDLAVQHHVARYNPTTGAFEWLDEVKDEKKETK